MKLEVIDRTGRLRASQRDYRLWSTLTDQSQRRASDDAALGKVRQVRQTDAETAHHSHKWDID
jgi:hypothetical protein